MCNCEPLEPLIKFELFNWPLIILKSSLVCGFGCENRVYKNARDAMQSIDPVNKDLPLSSRTHLSQFIFSIL